MTGLSINSHISEILNADSILSGYTSDIYPLIAENDVKFPFIIHAREEVKVSDTKETVIGDFVTFSVNIVSDKYSETVQIAERVRVLLEKRRDGYFNECSLISATEFFQDDAFVQKLRFSASILRR